MFDDELMRKTVTRFQESENIINGVFDLPNNSRQDYRGIITGFQYWEKFSNMSDKFLPERKKNIAFVNN